MPKAPSELNCKVAATVAGEDIRVGDFVTVLTETFELPSYLWDSFDSPQVPESPVRVKLAPCNAGTPSQVFAVCLPFVYTKSTADKTEVLDTRYKHLVKLDDNVAQQVWDTLTKTKKKKRAKKG